MYYVFWCVLLWQQYFQFVVCYCWCVDEFWQYCYVGIVLGGGEQYCEIVVDQLWLDVYYYVFVGGIDQFLVLCIVVFVY